MSAALILDQPWDEIFRLAALQGLTVGPVAGAPLPEPPEDDEGDEEAGPDLEGAKARHIYAVRCRLIDRLAPLIVCDAYVERRLSGKPPTELDELIQALEARVLTLPSLRSLSNGSVMRCLYDKSAEWINHPHFAALVRKAAEKWVRETLRLLRELDDENLESNEVPPRKPGKPRKKKGGKLPAAPVDGLLTMELRERIRQMIKDFCKKLPPLINPPAKRPKGAKVVSATGDLEAVDAWETVGLEALGETGASGILAWALSDAARRLHEAIPTFADPVQAEKLAVALLKIRMLLPVALAPMAEEVLTAGATKLQP